MPDSLDWQTRAAVAAAQARSAEDPGTLRGALRRLQTAIKGLEKTHGKRETITRYRAAYDRGATKYGRLVVAQKEGRKKGRKGARKRKKTSKSRVRRKRR